MKSLYLYFTLDHTAGGLEIELPLWCQLTTCLISSFTSTGLGMISYLPRLLFPSQVLKIRNCLISSFSLSIISPFWDVIQNTEGKFHFQIYSFKLSVILGRNNWLTYFLIFLRLPAQTWELRTYLLYHLLKVEQKQQCNPMTPQAGTIYTKFGPDLWDIGMAQDSSFHKLSYRKCTIKEIEG